MLILNATFIILLLIHTYTDITRYLLYNSITLLLAIGGVGYTWYTGTFLSGAYGFVACAFIMLLLYFLSRGGVGEGDVKLAPVLGLWLGLEQGLLCLLLSFVSGGIIGGILLLGGRSRKSTVPFGPFLCVSAVIAMLWGRGLVRWYLGLF